MCYMHTHTLSLFLSLSLSRECALSLLHDLIAGIIGVIHVPEFVLVRAADRTLEVVDVVGVDLLVLAKLVVHIHHVCVHTCHVQSQQTWPVIELTLQILKLLILGAYLR